MTRSERIDIVVGSGRRGQSYLYSKENRLYQLPLSYLVPASRWTNSPGYVDGQVHFDRLIPPRCLECHATSSPTDATATTLDRSQGGPLGLACQVCHRPGASSDRTPENVDHPALRVANPARLTPERQIDLCGLCHSGADRPLRRPAFTFVPGDRLADHLGPPERPEDDEPDAHGNQVALLARSRCFEKTPAMTCSTCHDVHETPRDAARLSEKCLACHTAVRTGHAETSVPLSGQARSGEAMETCVDCHMPRRPSRLIRIAQDGKVLAPSYRTHRIAVYPPGRSTIDKGGRGAVR